MTRAIPIGSLRKKGIGYQIRIPKILKKRWERATCMALARSLPSFGRAAMMPVAVVPRFDPRVSGYMRSSVMTPMPTSGVIAEVKMELLWTMKVQTAPMRMAMYPVMKAK